MAELTVANKKLRQAWALAPALLLPIGLAPFSAHALGLGTLRVDSALGQPLEARIELVGATPAQAELATIRMAPVEARERMGLSDPVLGGVLLRFDVKVGPGGRSYIQVTSSGPVREPFLDFVLQAVSPSGQVVRHYTVLLDPVGTAASPPAALPAVQPVPSRAPVSQRRPARDPFANVAPPRAGAEFGPVPPGATLWSIARRVRPSGVSLDDVMASIHRSNPQAFINGQPGLLKAGSKLNIPAADALRGGAPAVSAAEPVAAAAAVEPADAVPVARQEAAPDAAAPAAPSADAPPAEVRVIRSEDSDQAPVEATQAAALSDAGTGVGGNRIQLLEEALDASQQQNDALQQRMAALEDQIRTMADMMQASGVDQSAVDAGTDAATPATATPPAAETPPAESAPAAASAAVPTSEAFGRPWAWLLAVLAVVGLGGLAVRSRRRREVILIEDEPESVAAASDPAPPEPARPVAPEAPPSTRVEWVEEVPSAAEVPDEGFGDPVDTQIDLLAAYVGMADGASARQVHAEIMRAGTAQQKAQAEALMAKLSG